MICTQCNKGQIRVTGGTCMGCGHRTLVCAECQSFFTVPCGPPYGPEALPPEYPMAFDQNLTDVSRRVHGADSGVVKIEETRRYFLGLPTIEEFKLELARRERIKKRWKSGLRVFGSAILLIVIALVLQAYAAFIVHALRRVNWDIVVTIAIGGICTVIMCLHWHADWRRRKASGERKGTLEGPLGFFLRGAFALLTGVLYIRFMPMDDHYNGMFIAVAISVSVYMLVKKWYES